MPDGQPSYSNAVITAALMSRAIFGLARSKHPLSAAVR